MRRIVRELRAHPAAAALVLAMPFGVAIAAVVFAVKLWRRHVCKTSRET